MTPTNYSSKHYDALETIVSTCRSNTRVHSVYWEGRKLYADIVTNLSDPSSLSVRFAKAGYRVNKVECMGGDYFKFEMVLKS